MSGDHAALTSWIGRSFEREDVASARLVAEFEATLSPHLAPAQGVPLGFHWCLCPDILPFGELGLDGHPRPGVLLPETGLPRRMWAGGEINYSGSIHPGDQVKRVSEVEDAVLKSGKSGRLCFVTVRHSYSVNGREVINDRQDIVYREESRPAAAAPLPEPAARSADAVEITATPSLLFRYSAITFNGHRIHYDDPYARNVEGYEGLVVHGPLQATLMLNLAAKRMAQDLKRFSYRGLNPLICGRQFFVETKEADNGGLETSVVTDSGVVTMTGRADQAPET